MKRQHKSWLIAVLAVLAAAMVLTGCSLKEVKSLTITNPPATTYEVGTTPTIDFTVKAVMDDDTTKTLTYDEYKSVLKLTGFSTEEVGTFTATITYRNVSVTFDYEVVPSGETGDFAGGVGTETNPYIINTAEQFKKIGNSGYEGKYFKLGADIDLTDNDIQGQGYWSPAIIGNFSGTLDGNGFKITLTNTLEDCIALLGEAQNITIVNLDFYSVGLVTIVDDLYGKSTFDNVDRYGDMIFKEGNNIGAYMIYSNTNCDLTMKDCDNYVNIKGSALYVAAFIGYPMSNSLTKITFINCVNHGNLTGQRIGVFFANAASVKGGKITMDGCRNEGMVLGIQEAGFYFAIGQDDTKVGYIEDNNKTANLGDSKISVPAALEGLTVTVENDGKISVTKNEDIAYVIVRGYFYAKKTNSTDTWIQVKDETLTFSGNTATTAEVAKIKVAPAEENQAGTCGNYVETWVPGEKYYFAPHTYGNTTYILSGETNLEVFVLAFDADGELIGGCKA